MRSMRVTVKLLILGLCISFSPYGELRSQSALETFKVLEKQMTKSWKYEEMIPQFDSLRPILLEEKLIQEYLYSSTYQVISLALTAKFLKAAQLLDITSNAVEIYSENQDSINYRCDNGLMIDISVLSAYININLGNTFLAENYARKAIKLTDEIGNNEIKGIMHQSGKYQILADSYNHIGDYHRAIQYFKSAIEKAEIDNPQQIYWLTSIGSSFIQLNDLKNAQDYLNLARKKYYSVSDLEHEHYVVYLKQSLCFLKLVENKMKLAKKQTAGVEESLDSVLQLKPIHAYLLHYYQIRGRTAMLKENFIQADTFYEKAINYCLEVFSYNEFKVGANYQAISKSYYQAGKFEDCIRLSDLAIKALNKNKELSSELDYPNILNHLFVYESLLLKVKSLINLSKVDSAIILSSKLLSVFDYMLNKRIISRESKYHFVNKIKFDIEEILELLIEKQEFELAFELAQKVHGILVSLEINEDIATQQFNIPQEYIDYLNRLKIKISQKESLLIRLDKDDEQYNFLSSEIDYIQEELDKAIETIEKQRPGYHKLKYTRPKNKSFAQFQKEVLDNNTALIEYLVGENNVFTFIVTKDDIKIEKAEITDELYIHIEKLNKHLRSIDSKVAFSEFISSSNYLYQQLLKQPLELIPANINQLYIIPDNELNYIPFSVLFDKTTEPISLGRYDLIPYLVKDYDISYHYSSALLSTNTSFLNANLSGFAPSFSSSYSSESKLTKLLYNEEEILLIQNITDGEIHIDTAATLLNVRQSFNEYSITHLATHATCNDTLSFESKIHLEDGPLHAYDIHNMPHNLELAVLSACKTGDGELKKGEGIMSLARAFISSGCKSVITSLWNVNDRNSSILMESFYENLWKGYSINRSLAESKRDYLKNVNSSIQAHPYQWATFIAIGNSDLRVFRFPLGELAIIALLVLLIGIFLIRVMR